MTMECQNNFWPWFSEDEYKSRYARIRAAMAEKGLEALILHGIGGYLGNEPAQPNVVYITSFAAMVQTYVVFPLEGEPTVFGHIVRTPMKNPEMSYAHEFALTTPIEMGDVVMTEIAVGYGGYFGKIWGTFSWAIRRRSMRKCSCWAKKATASSTRPSSPD